MPTLTGKHPTVQLRAAGKYPGPVVFKKQAGRPEGRVDGGAVVRVVDRQGQFVAQAFYSPRSELALRFLARAEHPIVDEGWFRDTVRRAVALRRDVLGLDRVTNAWRAVYSEADHLPGLIVDRFGSVLSCQVASIGIYRIFPILADELRRQLGAEVIHVSADPRIAKLEGFPVPDSAGDAARTVIEEHGLEFEVDCARGHKTGFFLDQRDSRARIRDLARGRRVLDLFCYTGGFAINAARGGAEAVTAVDLDEAAIVQAGRNARRNELNVRPHFVHADAFDVLRSARREEWDLIVVDPAKQAQGPREKERALSYYTDLNALAFEKVARGGLVLTCSCTGVVGMHEFMRCLQDAARRAKRGVTVLQAFGAPADHPVPLDFPQAEYLKCVLLRVDAFVYAAG